MFIRSDLSFVQDNFMPPTEFAGEEVLTGLCAEERLEGPHPGGPAGVA